MTTDFVLSLLFLIFCLSWIALFCVFSWLVLFPWMQAQSVGQAVPMFHIIRMYGRKLPPRLIVEAFAQLNRDGQPTTTITSVEQAYLAHKPPPRTAEELVQIVRERTAAL